MKSILNVLVAGLVLSAHVKSTSSALAGMALPCVFAAKNMPEDAGHSAKAIAEAAVQAWIDCLGERPIVIPDTRLGMVLENSDPAGNAPLPHYLRMKEGPFHLTIGLKRRIHPSMSAVEIDAAIEFIANDGFPLPGLDVSYWRVTGLTPSSHPEVKHAVLAIDETGIVLEMEMEIFSIFGLDAREKTIPDKRTEPHAYLSFDLVRPLKVTAQIEIENFQQ